MCVCVHVCHLTQLMTVVSLVLIDPPEESGLRYRPKTQTSMPVLPGKLTCTLWDRVRTKGQIEGGIYRLGIYKSMVLFCRRLQQWIVDPSNTVFLNTCPHFLNTFSDSNSHYSPCVCVWR